MSAPRRLPWWGWALVAGAVFVVLVLAGLAGLVAWVGADLGESAEPEPIDCLELAQSVGVPDLPAGTSAASCTYVGFQDWQIEGTLTVPRSDLDSWLSQLPGSPALGEAGCTDAIACVQVDLTQVGEEVDAHYLDVAVLSESDGVAEVRMSAFTT
ncbi:hypothetical protein [Nocardioides panzhihuensis]|uniref:Uncharacterized protein n=1 Tax=Nocardioides panzhihuensis TaxID=860243 RepID=A0A7Z0DJ19_9ACTN|nr:hypothetical protein [Nocardioides panzhihuensis]NYI76495.1 hypothetical protein [Nocardioides panzhihuensis]